MMYKHQYFILDADSKKVSDENDKELRLTGNAYRMLVFLCQNKNANLTQIGDYFDWANDYNENNIRQYRYKVNTIIGRDVVEYKNGIYSIIGEVKETKKLENSQRNTDLLQEDSIRLEKDIMNKLKYIKFNIFPGIIASALLLLTFLDWPYAYYNFLRIVVALVAIYYGYYLYQKLKELDFWLLGLIAVAILFNPIAPTYLGDKSVWLIIDIITAGFFIGLIIKFKNKK